MKMISAFESGNQFGGGIVTKECVKYFGVTDFICRKNGENRILRHLTTFLNWLKTPFLHPIFCAFSPVKALPLKGECILNFSQTFNMVLRRSKLSYSIIVHDVLVQKRFFFHKWIKFSEYSIFKKANKIYVLSSKDARILRRFYKIPSKNIISIFELIFKVNTFKIKLIKNSKWKIFFLGSFDRVENLEAFDWFYKNVYVHVSRQVEIAVIGANKKKYTYKGIEFIGHLEDLSSCKGKYDMSIAPLRSGAGIKIKVLDSLRLGIPVLGTYKAYEGLSLPNSLFVSNHASRWISVLSSNELEFAINF